MPKRQAANQQSSDRLPTAESSRPPDRCAKPTSDSEPLIIVGAGLVGSLLAIQLARRGHRVELFERQPDLRRAETNGDRSSINLSLCERGLAVLDEIELGDALRAIAVPAYGRLIHDLDGTLTYQPYGNHGERTYSVLRNDLNKILLDEAEKRHGVRVHFGQRCVDLDPDQAIVQFEESATGKLHSHRASRLFGADGIFSAVRMRLQRTRRFNFSQQYLDHGYKELRLDLSGESEWMEHREVVHLWPRGGYMLLGLPNIDGTFVCALHLPLDGPHPSFESIQDEKAMRAFLGQSFPDIARHVPSFSEFSRTSVNHLASVRCFPWCHGDRVALVGDAAHAVFPFYAQGVNAGFEDCSVLNRCLDEFDNWGDAFQAYERRRKPNADAISDLSRNHFIELRDLVGQPNFQLRKRIERRLNDRFPDAFSSLYSLVTFSVTPYCEASARGREQDHVVDAILAQSCEVSASDSDLDQLIDRVLHTSKTPLPAQEEIHP